MPAKLEEIEGRFGLERHRFDQCMIGWIETEKGDLTIKGDADSGELVPGLQYRFYGRFSNYTNKRTGSVEKQFHFHTFVQCQAHDREGVIEYLARAGKGLGLGRGTANKLWEAFKSDAVRTIRQSPRLIRDVNPKVTNEQCDQIGRILIDQKATEDATIDVTNLLANRGFPKTTTRKAIKKWGNRAAEVIRKDPYSLMNFRGCGFKLCDALWLELGHRPDRLRRQALCAWHAVASNSEGHIWHPVQNVAMAICAAIGSTKADPKRAIQFALRLAKLSPDHYGALAAIRADGHDGPIVDQGGQVWIAEGRKAQAEKDLARLITAALSEATPKSITEYESREITWKEALSVVQCRRCSRELTAPEVHVWNGKPFGPTCIGHISDGTDVDVMPLRDWIEQQPPEIRRSVLQIPKQHHIAPFSLWPDPAMIKGIDDHQRAKLAEALVSRIAILGGSPGTGKTYATAMLIKTLLASGTVGPDDIAIGCPTGKAAVRITEALQAAGVNIRARTWHSLLGVGVTDDESGGWGFAYNESNPWPFRVIIGDEESMKDTALMCSVFKARPRGCHFLLVGDVNQLPPVGAGAPLRDMIDSGVIGYGELTEIKRNSGGIVEACAMIRDGKPWSEGDNLVVDPYHDQLKAAIAHCQAGVPDGIDAVWDCQVLVAVNAKSQLSRKIVNKELQSVLNPNPEVKGTPFRLGDKIVCLKNGKYSVLDQDDESMADSEDGEVYVANGELGRVVEIQDKSIIAELSNPKRIIRIPRGKSNDKESDDESSGAGCSWDLAYGLTCHKLQGSEAPVVIVLIDDYPGARQVCDRSWLYTAISRAKSKCILIGKKATADAMCRRVAIGKRRTFLRQLIQLENSKQLIEVI